ncbi:unnamed protein product [Euphydryas editha]|uniref:Uncharacterized protein n=1 Tax=Euphydryas editha TaxID=104508 RepID=A0AAU9ULH2_EUPED|nr:unnamed protein product [Euphydryas editha]
MLYKRFFEVICDNEKSSHVIKSIFLASKALQTFLSKYNEIERILKFDDDLKNNSTSSENDDNSNISFNEQNENQKNNFFEQIQNVSSTLRPGTEVIYESDSTEDENIDSMKINNEATNKANRLHIISNQAHTHKDSDNIDSEDIQEISIEIMNDKKVHKSKKPKVFQNILGEKTRFSIQRFRSNTSNGDNRSSKNFRRPLKIEQNARRIKKIIYSEKFSPKNIWQEIISRPIKLNKDDSDLIDVNFRSRNNDGTTFVIIKKKEKGDNNLDKKITDLVTNTQPKSLDKTKSKYLRKTYGDTCLQAPTKKCNKAIKAVNKDVCKRFKCKSEFKSSFIENGKKGCQQEFLYIEGQNDKNNNTSVDKSEDKIQPLLFRYQKRNDSFVDATRDRFFDKRYLRKNAHYFKSISLRNDTPESIIQLKPLSLRDKYERECQEENRNKCKNACKYATNKTCSAHSCENKASQAFKKSCKEECNKVFTIDKDSSSESSDSDSDDSDSDDSDTDSDRSKKNDSD